MKRVGKVLSVFMIIIIVVNSPAFTQSEEDCFARLKNASQLYDQGDYDGAIKILNEAKSICSYSKQDKIQVNKILILSYLGIDDLEAADAAAEETMRIDPNYEPDKLRDDSRLISLYDKYRPEERLVVGIYTGVNFSSVDVEKSYSVLYNNDAPNLGSYDEGSGIQIGGFASYKAYKDLWVDLGVRYRQSRYEHALNNIEGETVNYEEELNYIDIPTGVKYYFLTDRMINPFVRIGADLTILTEALATTSRIDEQDIVDRTDYREDFLVGMTGAVGASYRYNNFRFFTALQYAYYPTEVNEEGTRYADNVNVFKYFYVDDDFRMDNMQINIGAAYTIGYKIIKSN